MRMVALAVSTLTVTAAGVGWRTFEGPLVRVRYPSGWFATSQPLTRVTSPGQVLAVVSYRLPGNDRGADGCEPKQALDRLPPDGAFVYGWDYGDLRGTTVVYLVIRHYIWPR